LVASATPSRNIFAPDGSASIETTIGSDAGAEAAADGAAVGVLSVARWGSASWMP
jgi:hypothetical protein